MLFDVAAVQGYLVRLTCPVGGPCCLTPASHWHFPAFSNSSYRALELVVPSSLGVPSRRDQECFWDWHFPAFSLTLRTLHTALELGGTLGERIMEAMIGNCIGATIGIRPPIPY